jgi:hypothetical protein
LSPILRKEIREICGRKTRGDLALQLIQEVYYLSGKGRDKSAGILGTLGEFPRSTIQPATYQPLESNRPAWLQNA